MALIDELGSFKSDYHEFEEISKKIVQNYNDWEIYSAVERYCESLADQELIDDSEYQDQLKRRKDLEGRKKTIDAEIGKIRVNVSDYGAGLSIIDKKVVIALIVCVIAIPIANLGAPLPATLLNDVTPLMIRVVYCLMFWLIPIIALIVGVKGLIANVSSAKRNGDLVKRMQELVAESNALESEIQKIKESMDLTKDHYLWEVKKEHSLKEELRLREIRNDLEQRQRSLESNLLASDLLAREDWDKIDEVYELVYRKRATTVSEALNIIYLQDVIDNQRAEIGELQERIDVLTYGEDDEGDEW